MSDPPTQPPVKPPVQPPVPKPRAMTKIPSSMETTAKKEEENSTTFRGRSSSDITSSMKRGVTPPTKATFAKPTPTPLPRPHPPNSSRTTTEVKSDAPVPKKEAEEDAVKESNKEREEGAEPKRKPRPRRRKLSEDSDSGPDYENIDAHLDDELQAAMKKTDYVNWQYPVSDAEDEEFQYTGVRKMGPSVPLSSHPVLRKSQSTTDLDKSTEEDRPLRPVSQQPPRQGQEGPRPKNRAPPPPPPGKRKEREKTQESATDDARPPGHKRSQSDLPGQKPPPSENPQEGSPIARGGMRGSGRRPAPSYPAPLPETNPKQPPSADVKHDGIYATPQKVMKRNMKSREVIKSRASMEEKEDSPKVARDDRIYNKQKSKEVPSPKQDRIYSKPVKGGEHKKQEKQDRQIYSRSPKLGDKDKLEKSRPPKGGEPTKAAVYARPQRGNEQDAIVLVKPQRIYDKQDKQDRQVEKESGNIRPKRHAPPPPAGAKKASPDSSSPEATMSPDGGGGREGGGEERLSPEDLSGMEVGSSEVAATAKVDPTSTPPPKPIRQKNWGASSAKSLDNTDSPATNLEHHQGKGLGGREGKKAVSRGSQRGWEELFDRMDLFTIELNKEEGKGLGMVIVSGKVRSGDGAVVEGIFVQKVIPGSSADKDGRIQPGDMLVEIGGRKMVNGSLDEAIQLLRNCTISIKLRIGRPDVSSSVFANSEDGEEPIYVNELVGPAQKELFIKLEKAEIRIAELEGEKEKSEHSLKAFMEEAEEDKKGMQKKMEELRQEFERHKSESQQNMTNLTQALATITMDKAKNDKELERLREQLKEGGVQGEEIDALRRQLSEAQEAKKEIERSLKTYKAKDQEIVTLSAKVSELETHISQNQQERDSAQSELQQTRTELSSALEKVSTLDTRNKELSQELEQLKAQSAQQASGKTVEVELSQRSEELSSAQQELSQSRAEQERLSAQVAELSLALETEEARRVRLEESLQSQKNSEKSNAADLLEKLQLQAKQITDLKDELAKRSTPTPAAGENHKEEEEGDEGLGPPISVMPEDSDMHIKKEAELGESVFKPEKPLEETGQTVPTPQPEHKVSVLRSSVNLPESKPTPPKPSEKPKPKPPEKPKPPISEKLEPSHANPPEGEPERREISREPQDSEEISSVTEFDAIRPMKRLDSSTALYKSQVGSKLRRKKPSREYIRSMGSMTDLLEGLSMENLSETDETKKPERVKTPDGSSAPAVKPKIIPRKESPTNESTEPKKPKPMPRAAPRHKTPVTKPETSSTAIPEAGRRPQATPRHRREHSGTQNLEPEIKPKPEADVTPSDKQVPRSTESPVIDDKSRLSPTHKREHEKEEKVTPKHEHDSSDSHNNEPVSEQSPSHKPQIPTPPQKPGKLEEEHASPKSSPKKEPMKPGRKRSKFQPLLPKHSPVLQPKSVKEEPEDKCELPNSSEDTRHPSPIHRDINEVNKDKEGDVKALEHRDSKLEELVGKDPSELSVKEKALLAQKMLEKRKGQTPPLVPRKPSKPMGAPDQAAANSNLEVLPMHERTKSFDKLQSSPKKVKKILPGAVNIFGSPMRVRSATVSTDEPDTRRESIERSGEHGRYPELSMEPLPKEDIDAPLSEAKVPPKRPPPPVLKKLSDEKPTKSSSPKQQRYGTPTSDLDKSSSSELDLAADSSTGDLARSEDSNPLLQAAVHSPASSDLNYDNVLEWSSDLVAIWLTKIGLEHHKQIFQDEGIQGFMLFDLDGSRLKGLGMSSHDDRSILKKEVKALKPFADKQKKSVDKKRKEDKKQGKKKK